MWDKIYRVYIGDKKAYESFDISECVHYLTKKFWNGTLKNNPFKEDAWIYEQFPGGPAIEVIIKEERL